MVKGRARGRITNTAVEERKNPYSSGPRVVCATAVSGFTSDRVGGAKMLYSAAAAAAAVMVSQYYINDGDVYNL